MSKLICSDRPDGRLTTVAAALVGLPTVGSGGQAPAEHYRAATGTLSVLVRPDPKIVPLA